MAKNTERYEKILKISTFGAVAVELIALFLIVGSSLYKTYGADLGKEWPLIDKMRLGVQQTIFLLPVLAFAITGYLIM